ncbi:MAG: hypothetical protein EPN56_09055 [Rhodanobacter sp.]|nr:MAG: hypothetical protein EPN78_05600 [Rhodanobacter sp.]TAM13541.1 MAG: hypothetical protein EPN66_04530 [Rhodanobacter sp.]TAM35706.1 MAG: hypothetical protein EPN56_09055 [Rhodanobacter sp.]
MTSAADHRGAVLHALDIVPWRLRQPAAATVPMAADAAVGVANEVARCVVLLPARVGTRELDLLGRALIAAGPALARAARIRVPEDANEVAMPQAAAYLACGDAQAHVLGRSLPAQVTAAAQIVLVDPLDRLLHDGAAKRRLWMALRTLRRALTAAG